MATKLKPMLHNLLRFRVGPGKRNKIKAFQTWRRFVWRAGEDKDENFSRWIVYLENPLKLGH